MTVPVTTLSLARPLTWGRLMPSGVVAWLAARAFTMTWRPMVRRSEAAGLAHAQRSTVEAMGRNLVAYAWGPQSGPRVLLVHGWNGHAGQLTPYVEPLVAAGYRVIAFDGPAHGATAGRFTTARHMGMAVHAVADAFGGVSAVVAHSLGSAAVGIAARAGLKVERLALVAPVCSPEPYLEAFAGTIGLSERGQQRLSAATRDLAGVASWSDLDLMQATHLLPVPLIVHDRRDRLAPLERSEALVSKWQGGELLVTQGLGHRRILADAHVVDAVVGSLGAPRDTARFAPIARRFA